MTGEFWLTYEHGYRFKIECADNKARPYRAFIYAPDGKEVGKTAWCLHGWAYLARARGIVYAHRKKTESPPPMSENKVTEDGLIEKALRVMGAEPRYPDLDNKLFKLKRTETFYPFIGLSDPVTHALFIHEAKLFFEENGWDYAESSCKGHYSLNVYRGESDAYDVIATVDSGDRADLYAQAVLAASGQEIGQAETQAPSTTSNQTGEE